MIKFHRRPNPAETSTAVGFCSRRPVDRLNSRKACNAIVGRQLRVIFFSKAASFHLGDCSRLCSDHVVLPSEDSAEAKKSSRRTIEIHLEGFQPQTLALPETRYGVNVIRKSP